MIMLYKGYKIEKDSTGYAPKNLKYYFYKECDEIVSGFGESIEDCKNQINETISS